MTRPYATKTMTKPVEDLLRPPPAPTGPFATPASPFRAASPFSASPFAAAVSPFAKPSPFGGDDGKPPRPPGPSLSPFADRSRPGAGRPSFIRHITHVVIPPGRPARRSRWALSYDTCLRIWADYNECSLESDVLGVGSGLDFDLLACCSASADHRNQYCPHRREEDCESDWFDDLDDDSPSCGGGHGIDAVLAMSPLWATCDDMVEEWRDVDERGEEEQLDPEACQVLVFESTRNDSCALEGKYVVTGVVEHAWGDVRPEGAPSYMTGWHEVFLAPCDDDWNLTGP